MDLVAQLEQAGERTAKIVEGIGPDQMTEPTPCTKWDVRAVLNHLIGENYMFATVLEGKPLPDLSNPLPDFAGIDPAGAFRASFTLATQAWRGPGALETIIALPMGPTPAAFGLGLHLMDTVVHGWDIASGTGQDTTLDPDLAATCLGIVRDMLQHGRPPVFAPEIPVPAGAPAGDQLLGLLGRQAGGRSSNP